MTPSARRLQRGALYVLLFLLPFSKAAIEICFPVLLLGWLLEHAPTGWRSSLWRSPPARWLLIALGGYLALHKTRWGRFVYAIGGNPEAARLAGVNVKRVLVSVYVLIGCLAGLAGFILSARLGSAEAVAGISFELRVIASVVIGGTSLMGGYGRIGGTIIGSIIMGILINGLVLMNVSAYYQQIITGLIIVLAVAFDTYAKSRRGAL
jgi:inositol transport system permease protein